AGGRGPGRPAAGASGGGGPAGRAARPPPPRSTPPYAEVTPWRTTRLSTSLHRQGIGRFAR
ncbi:hypothetical protein OFL47_32930, partial [Pseudomonas aeruginosa]|uniref:hypothetical protein n=1 Tax=Pseudomonas aeruginosa TaxID=287 RepID=UPI0021F18A74